MSDRAEQLGQLTAKFAGWDAIFGGTTLLTKNELVAACSGVSVLGFNILMAKYTGDEKSITLLVKGSTQTINRKGLIGNPELSGVVALTAVSEFLGTDLCPGCNGRGSIFPKGTAVRTCKTCEGKGRVTPGQRRRARLAGVPVQEWRDHSCDKVVAKIRNILEREEGAALVIFFRKIQG